MDPLRTAYAGYLTAGAGNYSAYSVQGTVVARPGGEVTVVGGQAGILGVEADRTPGRVLAVQGPLRTTQHLDAIEVVGLQCLDRADALVDLIHVHGDRTALVLAEVLRGHAAQREGGLRLRAVGRVEEHVGHVGGDVARLPHAAALEVRGRYRGDRKRDVLGLLAAPLGGDDDLLECRVSAHALRPRAEEGGTPGQ